MGGGKKEQKAARFKKKETYERQQVIPGLLHQKPQLVKGKEVTSFPISIFLFP